LQTFFAEKAGLAAPGKTKSNLREPRLTLSFAAVAADFTAKLRAADFLETRQG
jgi:hypothetical protein